MLHSHMKLDTPDLVNKNSHSDLMMIYAMIKVRESALIQPFYLYIRHHASQSDPYGRSMVLFLLIYFGLILGVPSHKTGVLSYYN